MRESITFTIIKPDAVRQKHTGKIIHDILEAGFTLSGLRLMQMTRVQAEAFYAVHRERPFFRDLVDFMTGGPVVVAVLKKDNAVSDFRALIGHTDPKKADPHTIRARYAQSIEANAIHGSDSDENARIEAAFFFAGCTLV